MLYLFMRPRHQNKGQGLVEYALTLALIAVVVVAVLTLFGEGVQATYCRVVDGLTMAGGGSSSACDGGGGSGGGGGGSSGGALQVSCVGSPNGTTPFSLEAVVVDTVGADNIQNVKFYIDGGLNNTQVAVKYCLKDGDATCEDYDPSGLLSGPHTIRAEAIDQDGNTGYCEVPFNKP